jgi:hypothetical protein
VSRAEPYERAAAVLLRESGCTVRGYRSRNTGRAFTRADDWGIEVPRPRGPVSFAVFAHEVGHQLLHRGNGKTGRWLEEVEAWEYALAQFDRFALPGVERARVDAAVSLRYAAAKSLRGRLSSATARAILDRMPEWVWHFHDPRDAVTDDTHDRLLEVVRDVAALNP